MKRCINCGYEGEEILICPKCGGNMEHPDEPLMEEPKEEKKYTAVAMPEPKYNAIPDPEPTESPKMKKGFLSEPLTRKAYWIYVIASYVAASLIGFVLDLLIGDGGRNIAYFALLIFWIILQIKRLRDANKSLAWILLDLLSIVGIIVVGCFPSNHVNNKWVE